MKEFELIETLFRANCVPRDDVLLGIGDDAAIVSVANKHSLVIAMDSLVADVHFDKHTPPHAVGYKACAVNLSDLAAMGAMPLWVCLSLTLPHVDEAWLTGFYKGFSDLCKQHNLSLIGGDTTQGPLNIGVCMIGHASHPLRRGNAKAGDLIYVTGTLGKAGYAWRHLSNLSKIPESFLKALHYPQARIEETLSIARIAHSAIDLSDGLVADLKHILEESQVGATIYTNRLPIDEELIACCGAQEAIRLALAGGEDYEICFTIPPDQAETLTKIIENWNCPCTFIGHITENSELTILNEHNQAINLTTEGYEHFTR